MSDQPIFDRFSGMTSDSKVANTEHTREAAPVTAPPARDPTSQPTVDASGKPPRERVRHGPRNRPVLGATVVGLQLILRPLPLWLLHAGGRAVGAIMAFLPTRSRHRCEVNVDLCFPDMSLAERRRLVRKSLQHAACGALELASLWRRDADQIHGLIRHIHGEEHLAEALARGKGVVLAAPHLGSWEFLGLWFSSRMAVTALYRRPRIKQFDRLIRRGRNRFQPRVLEAKPSSLRELLRALRRNEFVMLLPDQVPARQAGVFVQCFGKTTFLGTLLPRIALRGEAQVLWVHAERLPGGAGFDMHIRPGQPLPEETAEAVAVMSADLERTIESCREQYLWRYRRFRVRPKGVRSPYRR